MRYFVAAFLGAGIGAMPVRHQPNAWAYAVIGAIVCCAWMAYEEIRA